MHTMRKDSPVAIAPVQTGTAKSTVDYSSSYAIAGPLHYPHGSAQAVTFRDVLSRRQKWILWSIIFLNVASITVFLMWLLSPDHVPNMPRSYREFALVAGIGAFGILLVLELLRLSQSLVLSLFACRMKDPIPLVPKSGLRVAMLTTIVPSKEPVDLVARTLAAMRKSQYDGQVDVWILDEGDDPEVQRVARQLGVHHFSRKGHPEYNQLSGEFRAKSKAGNHNAWRAQNEHRYDIVAQMDPDHVPLPEFLERTLGYFRDPDVGFVVAPQVYGNLDENFVSSGAADQSYLFHGVIQRGGNGLDAPLLIGTNHLYRVSALQQIGGYQDSIIEDHLTSLTLHTTDNPQTGNRWKGIYTPDILAVGEGPSGWTDYFNQQQRWAYGIWDIVRTMTRRMLPGLSWPQRFAYIGLQSFYPSVAVVWLLGGTLTLLYLLFGVTAIHLEVDMWLRYWLPTVLSQFTLFFWLRRFNLVAHERKLRGAMSGLVLSLATGPIYVMAGIASLLRRPLVYVVTAKSTLASADSFSTFRFHAIWASVATSALALGGMAGHTHTPLQAWAVFTIAAALLPILIFSIVFYRQKVITELTSWSTAFARASAMALPLAAILVIMVGTAATWKPILQSPLDVSSNSPEPPAQQVPRDTTVGGNFESGSEVDASDKPAEDAESTPPDIDQPPHPRSGDNEAPTPDGDALTRPVTEEDLDTLSPDILFPGESGHLMYGVFDEEFTRQSGDFAHVYYQFSEMAGSFAGFVDFSRERRQLAVISWEPRLHPIQAKPDPMDMEILDRIADGEYDDYIRSVAQALGGTNTPVILRFAFEMDLEANGLHPWGGSNPEVFVTAHQRVVNLFREEEADNVRWLWSPSAMTDDDGQLTSLPYYPGSEYVDFTGFSAFVYWEWEEWSDERADNNSYRMPSEYMTRPIDDLASLGHPIVIPELGVDLHPSLPEHERELWLRQLALELHEGNYPEVVGIIYFDTKHNWDDEKADWRLTLREREIWISLMGGNPADPEHMTR